MHLKGLKDFFISVFCTDISDILFKEIRYFFISSFVLTIVSLTVFGIRQTPTEQHNELLPLLASIVGTILTVFFSLVVLHIQHIAGRYSPKFLKFVLRDILFKISFGFFAFTLIYYVYFIYAGFSDFIAIASILLFVFSIIVLWQLVKHIIKISDPYYSILEPAYTKIVKEIDRAIPRFYKQCRKDLLNNGIGEKQLDNMGLCKIKVDERIVEYIKREILPIREIASKAIRDMDLETSRNALMVMGNVVIKYFKKRADYQDEQDPLMYFIYEELDILSKSGTKEFNLRLDPYFIDCWAMIGKQVSKNRPEKELPLSYNFNALATWPIKALKDLCLNNFKDFNSYAPTKASNALGDIGVYLIVEGYDNQAAEIVEELTAISILAIDSNLNHIVSSANYAIMRIYYTGVANRNKGFYDEYNHVYEKINTDIEKIILAGLSKGKLNVSDNQIFGSFFGFRWDLFKSQNFAVIAEAALFTQGLEEHAIKMNLKSIENNIDTLAKVLLELKNQNEWYFYNQAVETLYQIMLKLLSYINISMAKDHVFFYKDESDILVNEKLSVQATDIGIKIFKNLKKQILNGLTKGFAEEEHLETFFSIFLIVLYEDKIRKNSVLDDLFDSFVVELCELLKEYEVLPSSDSNDVLYKYYRLLKLILENKGLTDINERLNVPKYVYKSKGPYITQESEYPKPLIEDSWILKRPGFQVNAGYYNEVEEALTLGEIKL
ncbi:MAG: DUF2254 family protein [Candidatus Paceibacterota bacterium]